MSPDPDDLEQRLREALRREADRITPSERRTEILAMTQHENQHENQHAEKSAETARRWLIPAATAASVALIGVAVWGVSNAGGNQQVTPAVASTSTTAPTDTQAAAPVPNPSPAATSNEGSSPAAAANGKVAGATTPVTLPAYFVGAISPAGDKFGLYREFTRTSVPVGASSAQRAKAALAVAMNAQPLTSHEPYLQAWSGTSVNAVAVTPGRITITLSGPGANGLTAAKGKLAVQQLVWTAQAAVGQGNIPVKFAVASGASKLFETYPTAQTYNRPPTGLQYEVLAPIWITSPVRGQVFSAGVAVVTAGQSCAFEGTTQWQLKRGGATVRSGSTTASSGCPTRGTWQVKLGVLPAGGYTFRMYEASMHDGQGIIAETSKPFTVR